jgi:hypothetical protein
VTDLHVRVGEPRFPVAPDLWGLFLEDINHCLDGGLNAELVRNGDFEFNVLDNPAYSPLTGWEAVGDGRVEVRADDPVHPATRHYLRVTGPLRLTNDGWDGVLVRPGEPLRFAAAGWRIVGSPTLGIAVTADDGATLASASLDVDGGGWNWVTADLVPVADRPTRGRLSVSVPDGARIELDCLSLRPLLPDGTPALFRADLVDALRALNPSFVRFPGGCIAHGVGLGNVYHWKPSVGPRHERPQPPNAWGYHQSRQIGYYEYFLLCEALGATPLPVVAAGVCCQNTRGGQRPIPQDEMPGYVRDVLDLVEFANGGLDTPWGARRADLGHPEPFGLRYLGLGNEDQITDDFRDRYAAIEDAVRAAHPEVVVIGTSGPWPDGEDYEAGWAFARERGVAVVDEHAYRNPRWYHQNVTRYDGYPRGGPLVYFGEYAANGNTLRSALAEAAFMVGMERNGDVVALASYAPLLARIGQAQWIPDLIYFDSDDVHPSVNYHVQEMFASERGAFVCAVDVAGADPVPVALPASGTARIEAVSGAFEISGMSLDGRQLDDLSLASGDGERELGAIDPSRCVLDLAFRLVSGTPTLRICFGAHAPSSFLDATIGSSDGTTTVVNRNDDGVGHAADLPIPWGGTLPGCEVRVRVELDGTRARLWVDGELRHDYVQDLSPEHRVVAGATTRAGADGAEETVVRLVNATDTPRAVTVTGRSWTSGTARVLAGSPDDGAPEHASPVAPADLPVAVGPRSASLDLPAWSLAVAVLAGA